MLKKIAIFLIGICFLTCQKIKEESTVQMIDLSPNSFEESTQLNLSSIASKIEYIPLETNEKAMFGYIYNSDVTFFEDTILLQDKGVLFVFNSSGEFLNTIGDIGNGPGEHSKNFQFRILPQDKLIAIYDQSKDKVFFHTFKGQFVSEIAIDFNPRSFITFNNHLVFFNAEFSRKDSDYYVISVVDKTGVVIKKLLHRPDEKALEKKMRTIVNFYVESQNVLNNNFCFLEEVIGASQKTIWELTEQFNVLPKYTIKIDDNVRPLKDYTASDFNIINNTFFKYNAINKYIETEKYAFFNMLWGDKNPPHACIMFDKETKNRFRVFNKDENKLTHRFVNDIDGGMPFWPFWKVSENKVASPIMVSQLKKYLEDHKNDDTKILSQNSKKVLEDLVANSKETDNPILMVVTLKY